MDPAPTPQAHFPGTSGEAQGNFAQGTPLPGFEAQTALDRRLKPFAPQVTRQTRRQITATRLAHRLAGREVHLERTPAGTLMIDDATDQIIVDEEIGGSRALRFAALLLLSAADDNHIVGQFNAKDGKTFPGSGQLEAPSIRTDPGYMDAMRRRTRKVVRASFLAMETGLKTSCKEAWGYEKSFDWAYRPLFLTLTMPHLPGADTLAEVRRFNLAFRLFTRSEYWKASGVLGGIKAVEDKLTDRGPHVHGHLLVISRRLDLAALTDAWRAAVDKATWKLAKVHLAPANPPDVEAVKSKARRPGEIALDAALDEVCKYLTKLADLLDPGLDARGRPFQPPSPAVLLGLCEVARWPRMVEQLGACRTSPTAPQGPGAGLDTSCISVLAARVALAWLIGQLEKPCQDLQDLLDLGPLEPEERQKLFGEHYRPPPPLVPIEREKAISWRKLMPQTTLFEWLQIISARVDRARAFRVRQLRQQNPDLDVVSLAGTEYRTQTWPDADLCALDQAEARAQENPEKYPIYSFDDVHDRYILGS